MGLPTPFYDDEKSGITIYVGRCEDILPGLKPNLPTHTVTDPPYDDRTHDSAKRVADMPDGGWRTTDFGFDSLSPELMKFCAREFTRLSSRWSLVFSAVEQTHIWRAELVAAGLDYVRTGAWVRENTSPQFSGDRPGQGFEPITICHATGKKKWNGGGMPGVWNFPIVSGKNPGEPRTHPTQKPLALMRRLVLQFTDPGDVVIDPFMGSGTTIVACREEGRRAIGIEMQEDHARAAVARLKQNLLFA